MCSRVDAPTAIPRLLRVTRRTLRRISAPLSTLCRSGGRTLVGRGAGGRCDDGGSPPSSARASARSRESCVIVSTPSPMPRLTGAVARPGPRTRPKGLAGTARGVAGGAHLATCAGPASPRNRPARRPAAKSARRREPAARTRGVLLRLRRRNADTPSRAFCSQGRGPAVVTDASVEPVSGSCVSNVSLVAGVGSLPGMDRHRMRLPSITT